jgi:citrate lyase subunit beta/citryl-CoA lyase
MQGADRLRRSLLFVPGGDARKLARALESQADALILDLEDAVPPERKPAARAAVEEALREGSRRSQQELAVRVNAPGTPWCHDDLAAVVRGGATACVLPKCEDADALARVAEALDALEAEAGRSRAAPVRLLALVESAAGVGNARAVAAASPRVAALCFGHADFSLDMRLPDPDPTSGVIHHARCALALAARAADVAPIDTVFLDVRDPDGFRADADHGRRLGFEGKLCIHPAQAVVANEVHTPSAQEIDAARRVVTAWEQARAEGRGVFALEGRMVDAPLVAVHERVLERARRAGVLEGGR